MWEKLKHYKVVSKIIFFLRLQILGGHSGVPCIIRLPPFRRATFRAIFGKSTHALTLFPVNSSLKELLVTGVRNPPSTAIEFLRTLAYVIFVIAHVFNLKKLMRQSATK